MAKSNHIQSAMRNHVLVMAIVAALVAFGIYALPKMNKDEFPQFTIRVGVVAAVYPGATAEEVQEQVTKPLESYLFSFNEVNKRLTYSTSRDGICYIFVQLNRRVTNAHEVWTKIRGGMSLFKMTSLPQGLAAVAIIDDFGATSSVLLSIASKERSPRELERYTDQISAQLRTIPEMGAIRVLGKQKEEIAVTLDVQRITKYSLNESLILSELAAQGFRSMTGEVKNPDGTALLHVDIPYESAYDIGEQIVFPDPVTGQNIRLRDIATIERRYQPSTSYIKLYDGDDVGECILVSIEMTPGNNIVAFGHEVDKVLDEQRRLLPPDIIMTKITDQPDVVNSSVISFLRDLLESIVIVILVMLLLFPMRTALVSCTGLPVCMAATLGIMYLTGVELNSVTLAALIVVLGMIVDDSVIVIDGYTNLLEQGHSRWYSAVMSTTSLCVPMVVATCSVSAMFFPALQTLHGEMGDFVKYFPYTIFIALTCSIFYAIYIIPYLSTRMIKPQRRERMLPFERVQKWFFDKLQKGFDRMLKFCFRHPWGTIGTAVAMIGLGVLLLLTNNIQLMPKAERKLFAVEIHLAEGSSLEQTEAVADSLARVLKQDKRVKAITSFVGMASPRFHVTYAPQMAAPNYGQFIVSTVSTQATEELITEYMPRYENAFPNAYCRFKQLDYQMVNNPVEIHIKGTDYALMEPIADSIKMFMSNIPEMTWVHIGSEETMQTIRIRLKEDEATRLGITQATLSMYLNSSLSGRAMTGIWEDGIKTPVVLYTAGTKDLSFEDICDMMIPSPLPGTWVPLRQIAEVTPDFRHASLSSRNGIPTLTIAADMRPGKSQPRAMKQVNKYIASLDIPEGVEIALGGTTEKTHELMPDLFATIIAALVVIFGFIVFHFRKISLSVLSMAVSTLCIFGGFFGLWLFRMDFTLTCVLGFVSLIGIIVRNAIIMYEYAEELVHKQHLSAREAAYLAGTRRMRPIFLTSATTALGVVPMITAQTGLWMPMGVVICFGTIFTMPLVLTVLPIAYWKTYEREERRDNRVRAAREVVSSHVEMREQQIEKINQIIDERINAQ